MKTNDSRLLNLLSNNDVTFFIPPYQRNYEWSEPQCQVFLDDIANTCTKNICGQTHVEHFFGAITYFQTPSAFGEPDRLILVDGQQRITTTMLFLAALRDLLKEKEARDLIDKRYLINPTGKDEGAFTVKLKQVESDWPTYKKLILGRPVSEPEKGTAVYQNYDYFKKELWRRCKPADEKGEAAALDLVKFGLSMFRVVTIELEPMRNCWENPQEIFESMNSLGKPLSFADLVRNYLLLGLDPDTQTDYYDQYWMTLERELPGQVSNFIRDYMQMRECRPLPKATDGNAKQLYRAFKEIFSEEVIGHREGLLTTLASHATTYANILSGGTGNVMLDRILGDFRILKVTTAYSFFLALLQARGRGDFTDIDLIIILETFRTYIIRRRICELVAGENKGFPLLCRELKRLKEVKDKKEEMFRLLRRQQFVLRLPSDKEVSDRLGTMNFYSFQYRKFCLALVEESLTKSRPDIREANLQVEHIMPQTLSDAWKKALGLEEITKHQQVVNLIGNLTLIRHNQELGQKLFAEKREVYENNAGLQIAKSFITDQTEWTSETIRKRTEWLTEVLTTRVLPIPSLLTHDPLSLTTKLVLGRLVGQEIAYVDDPTVTAKVVEGAQVLFEGRLWHLSPLTKMLKERSGTVSASGAYRGIEYWRWQGKVLTALPLFD